MTESRLQLGTSIWAFYFRRDPETWPSLDDAARTVLDIDGDLGLEVWGSTSPGGDGPDPDDETRLVDACRAAAFTTVHARQLYWDWNPAGLRCEVDLAERLTATTLVLHPSCLGLSDPDDRVDFPEIARIARYAEDRGVRLALENAVDSMWALDRVLETVGDDPAKTNLGICIDVGHAFLSADAGRLPVRGYLERYAAQLIHLHLHDTRGECDDHLAPGDGVIDWPDLFSTLAEAGFRGTAVLEVHDPAMTPQDALRLSLERLRPWIGSSRGA